jgi:tRNA A-37 threonylcarbamoyl transferase component Bud32
MTFDQRHNLVLDSFENAWATGQCPELSQYVPGDVSVESPAGQALLVELMCIDMEYRWKSCRRNKLVTPCSLESYLNDFPGLVKNKVLWTELQADEYRVRQRWGDRPSHERFMASTDRANSELAGRLRLIDEELRIDEAVGPYSQDLLKSSGMDKSTEFAPQNGLDHRDFLLERHIGSGGTGKVYQARQRSLNRCVAVKYLRKSLISDAHAVATFVREAQIVAKFQHRSIVSIYGIGVTPQSYFMALEFVAGDDLAKLALCGNISPSQSVAWLIEACDAIEHAHDHGVIHCDLKPSNILIDQSGHVHVTDFGFAVVIGDTSLDRLAGTAPFMAPEQVSDCWGQISPATDVYGLGAVLYSLLARRAPWHGDRVVDILSQVVSGTPVSTQPLIKTGSPTALIEVCERCLVKNPQLRFRSVVDLRAQLRSLSRADIGK